MHLKFAFRDLNKGLQEGPSDVALKDALEVAFELHLFVHLSMQNSAENDSIKYELEVTHYVAPKGVPEIYGALKNAQKCEQ